MIYLEADNKSVNSGKVLTSDFSDNLQDMISGYKIIGLHSYGISTASVDGTGANNCYSYEHFAHGNSCWIKIKNTGSTTAKVKLWCYALCVEDSMYNRLFGITSAN